MITEKSTDPIQKFYAKAQKALATGHFSYQLGFWGAVVPPPYKQGCAVQIRHTDLQYK